MEFIPHLLIEGMITTPVMHWANLSYIYIRGEYMWVYKILERAINEAKADFGKNILGSGYDLELYVHGAGAYICGEETALIESLEGKRGNPRIKPPFLLFQDFGQIQRLSIT
jgi:NADH-quinone oxidoreductase subunit F